ncbi:MAG TPA: ribonuclease PH [Acidimicrobiales bacterium]|nr:ribonuclease PH [Acidimicrobiales bacterium]
MTPTGSPAGIVRRDGRAPAALRPFEIVRGFTEFAAGSVLMTMGRTKVLCTASLDKEVPRWMQGRGRGWVTAEYSLLPGSSSERVVREATKGRQSGRTQEIQRLIGRSLRAICDLEALGERQVILDCDVLQADGGTRTAAVTGAYVALCDACEQLVQQGQLPRLPIIDSVAAVSVGIVDGVPLLDLDYEEDARAGVDMNVVLTGTGKFVEVQGTAERDPFTREELDELIDLASSGLKVLSDAQASALALPLARNAPG